MALTVWKSKLRLELWSSTVKTNDDQTASRPCRPTTTGARRLWRLGRPVTGGRIVVGPRLARARLLLGHSAHAIRPVTTAYAQIDPCPRHTVSDDSRSCLDGQFVIVRDDVRYSNRTTTSTIVVGDHRPWRLPPAPPPHWRPFVRKTNSGHTKEMRFECGWVNRRRLSK